MTMHEALYFIRGLHDYTERSVANKGPWCWPTRELLASNVAANRDRFTGGARNQGNFRMQLGIARRRGWVVEEGCSPHCHAMHVRLTGAGLEALRLMDEHGCNSEKARPCVTSGLHLHRKAA